MAIRDRKDGGEINHMHGLQISKFTLGNLYKWGKDYFEKILNFSQDACRLKTTKCKAAELASENARDAMDVAGNVCNTMPRMLVGSDNPSYIACYAFFEEKESVLKAKQTAQTTVCTTLAEAKCSVMDPIQRFGVWLYLYGAGEALKAIDAVILHLTLPDRTTNEEFEFTEATYENVITLNEWYSGKNHPHPCFCVSHQINQSINHCATSGMSAPWVQSITIF